MNKNNLTKSLFTALLLVSGVVSADEQYPAADFQPSVVYQDESHIKSNTSSQSAVKQNSSAAASTEVDDKYPAANFQPQVVYSDNNYKHDKSVPVSKKSSVATSNSTDEIKADTSAAMAEKKKDDSSTTYLLGLIALGAAGFFLFRQQSPATTTTKRTNTVAPNRPAGLTGVARYVNRVSGTGVSRYVEQQVKNAKTATGVAKYVAKQTLAAKTKPEKEAKTGVEKYLRDRG